MTYGIIGVGSIAAAIVIGLCEHAQDAPSILLSPRNASRAANLAARFPTVRVAQSNQEVIDASSVLILCLRPQDACSVLPSLSFSKQQAVISVMAGISMEALHELVAPAQNIARAIPLPSVAARDGATPIYPATEAAKALFDRLGSSIEVPDAVAFEATSASTATIAAHFAYLNTICQWLIAQGVSDDSSKTARGFHFRRTGRHTSRSRAGLWKACSRPRHARRDQRTVPGSARTGARI